ncbi:MAG: AAA family ATPase [Atopobiaceae bacterium]|nr:AAA family ATPase [Atopobiaceae bacterium]
MNIREATQQVEGAVRAYLARDERGLPLVPDQMQRPLILMGPPGIGKTAIVAQIAERMGINFVSYSITHHTRQSALGLPYIDDDVFGGRSYKVSRYTMSEIIAATHDAIASTGVREGILFLDEVNCASETLAPAMLQFLQYKTFGQHRLPQGWIIVCAGNPPEYNRAARDFDPAMMDRMKKIDIEPDVDVWMDYAIAHGVHPAITTYLANKPKSFYKVRSAISGARIVTARGWEDLSRMLLAYEHEGLDVSIALVSQYLQDSETAEDFSLYYDLFAKYEDDYKVGEILAGTAGSAIEHRARLAPFDERIALVNLLLDAVIDEVHDVDATEAALRDVRSLLTQHKADLEGFDGARTIDELASRARADLDEMLAKGAASASAQRIAAERSALLEQLRAAVAQWAAVGSKADSGAANTFEAARGPFNAATLALMEQVKTVSGHLDAALAFLDRCFGDGQEMLVFASHLAVDPVFMRFVSAHGSDSFVAHSQALMFHERGLDLLREVDELQGL